MTEPAPVPETLEQALDPAWLTLALQERHPGIEVTKVSVRTVDTRISTNARFTIECAGGVPDGISADLCVKGYFGDEGRPYAHIGEPEARFYANLAEPIGVRTLRSHYGGADPETGAGVFITEDIITEGGEFLDALSPYTVDQAAQSLSEFARLHAFGWNLPDSVPRHGSLPASTCTSSSGARTRSSRTSTVPSGSTSRHRPAMQGDSPGQCARWQAIKKARAGPSSTATRTSAMSFSLPTDTLRSSTGSSCSGTTGESTSGTTSLPRSRPRTASGRNEISSGTTSTSSRRAACRPRRGTRRGPRIGSARSTDSSCGASRSSSNRRSSGSCCNV